MVQRLRIGVHGIPNAGKTALQAVLRLVFVRKIAGARVRLFFDDEGTNEYLAACEKDLAEHRTVSATRQGKPNVLRWKMEINKDSWQVESMDFSGALVEPGVAAEVQPLTREVKEFLGSCDVLFLLMDATDPDRRQLNALNLLKNYLRECRTHHGSDQRLLALLWTKVDRLGPLDDPEQVMQRVRDRLRGMPAFEDIADFLSEDEHLFRQFPVSAYGGEGPDGMAPQLNQIKPFGMLEPLHWAATTSTGVIADDISRRLGEARHRVKAIREGWPRFLPPRTAAMLRCYDELVPEHQVDDPMLLAEVQADRVKIQRHRRRWRMKATAVGVLALAAALGSGYLYGRAKATAAYDRYVSFATGHPEDADAAQRRSDGEELLQSTWARPFWLGHQRRADIEERIENDRIAEERHAFTEVVAQRKTLIGNSKAVERMKLLETAPFRNGRMRVQYDGLLAEDKEAEEHHHYEQITLALQKLDGDSKAVERKKVIEGAKFRTGLHKKDFDLMRDKAQEAHERYVFEQVRGEREKLAGDDKAMKRRALVENSPFRDGKYRVEYEGFIKADDAAHYRHLEKQERTEIVEAAASVEGSESARALYRRCEDYAKAYPDAKEADAVLKVKSTARDKWEEGLWREAVLAEQKAPADFQKNRERYLGCLKVPGATLEDRVKKALAEIEVKWDKYEYDKLYAAAKGMNDWVSMSEVRRMCREYRDSTRTIKPMLAAVREFLNWTDEVESGKVTCSLVLPPKVIEIPFKSDLRRYPENVFTGYDYIEVKIDMNKTSWAADKVWWPEVTKTRYEADGFRVAWTSNQEVELTLENKDRKTYSRVRLSLGDMTKLQGEVEGKFKEDKGIEIPVKVEWKCPDMDLSKHRLPEYVAGPRVGLKELQLSPALFLKPGK